MEHETNERWLRYRLDPTVGPLVAQHNRQSQVLDILKSDLRTSDNIDAIISLSRKQLRTEAKIWNLLGGRPAPVPDETALERWLKRALKLCTFVLLVKIALMLF